MAEPTPKERAETARRLAKLEAKMDAAARRAQKKRDNPNPKWRWLFPLLMLVLAATLLFFVAYGDFTK